MACWFEEEFGFPEGDYEKVRKCFRIETNSVEELTLITVPPEKYASGGERRFHVGQFDTPSVRELESMLTSSLDASWSAGGLTFSHCVGDVRELHLDPNNEGAVFQAASQFNCLEMVGPTVTPEDGITQYCFDCTQGPKCAMTCPAGTVFRNYFVGTHGQGGKGGKQLDLLLDIGIMLDNTARKYWKMKNGYVLPAVAGTMTQLRNRLQEMDEQEWKNLSRALRVGVHWDTELQRTGDNKDDKPPGRVAQVYCSALPLSYMAGRSAKSDWEPLSKIVLQGTDEATLAVGAILAAKRKQRMAGRSAKSDWEPLAKIVLQGTYEATLAVGAILAAKRKQRVRVYLTKVGGGVFCNPTEWITDAIQQALDRFQKYPIDVVLVHYGHMEPDYTRVLK